jgi:hypothetical protein
MLLLLQSPQPQPGLLDEFWQKGLYYVWSPVSEFFLSIPWSLIGWSVVIIAGAGLIGWGFKALRAPAAATIMTLGGVWYGYYLAKKAEEERRKREEARKPKPKVEKKEWGWQ